MVAESYSAGTVWLQVAPSFLGLQDNMERNVRQAMDRVGKDVDRQAGKMENRLDVVGKEGGKRLANSFERVARPAFQKIEKDLKVLGGTLGGPELDRFEKRMAALKKVDLGDVAGQAAFLSRARQTRREIQGIIDDANRGNRQINELGRGALGSMRDQIDTIEKSMRDWDRRTSKLDVEINTGHVRQQMRGIQNEIRTLSADIKLTPDMDLSQVNARIAQLRAQLAALEATGAKLDVDVDTTQAMIQLRMLEAQANKAATSVSRSSRIIAALDAGSAANSVRVFNGALFTTLLIGPALIPVLGGVAAGIFGIGAAAVGALGFIGVLVAGLAGIGGAVKALDELNRAQRLEKAGASANKTAAADQRQAVQDARSIADAQRGLARAREDAARGIANANRRVADAERSLADAQRNAARAAEDANRRVRDAQEGLVDARAAAAQALERAAERTADAEERLADAQQSARKAQEDLNLARQQAVRDLEDLANALDDSRLKERDLQLELGTAKARLQVLVEDDQATDLERQRAQLAVDEATEALEQQRLETQRLTKDNEKAAKSGVEGTERVLDAKERLTDAQEAEADAQQAVAEARQNERDAAVDAARSIDDAEQVLSDARAARTRQIGDNARSVAAAQRDLADAQADVTRAQVDGATAVADAQRSLGRAHEDIRLRAAEAAVATGGLATATDNLNEAMRGLSPAGQAFALWLYSLKPLLDELRHAVQEGFLPGLQEGMALVVDTYAEPFIDFMGQMAEVTGDLAKAFGEMLVSPAWMDIFAEIGEFAPSMLRQFGEISMNFLTGFMQLFVAFLPFMSEMGDWLIDVSKSFSDWAAGLKDSEGFETFLQYLRDALPEVNELLGNIGQILVNLFIGLAPYADDLLQNLIKFSDWLAEMDPDDLARLVLSLGALALAIQTLAGAMSLISGIGGLFGGALKLLGLGKTGGAAGAAGAGGAVAGGAAGGAAAGGGLLAKLGLGRGSNGITGAFDDIAAAFSRVGLRAGGARVAVSLLGKGLLALTGPVGIAIGIVWLLVDAFVWAYNNVEWFRTGVDDAMAAIGAAFTWVYETFLKPWFDDIAADWNWMRAEIIDPFVAWLTDIFENTMAPLFTYLYEVAIKPTMDLIGGVFEVVWGIIRTFGHIIREVFEHIIAPVFQWLYDTVIEPIMGDIGDAISWAWDHVIRPVFTALGDFIADHVAPRFRTAVETIANIWAGLLDAVRAPVYFIVDTIVNRGLIGGFNWLADRTGMDRVTPIDIPASLYPGGKKGSSGNAVRRFGLATGGVLPGYTPGMDVHDFYSPTAGWLSLSGGEGILRPEIVQALGTDRFNAANAAARSGRPEDGAKILGGFKSGGILDDILDGAASFGRSVGGGVASIAQALGNPLGWLRDKLADLIGGAGLAEIPKNMAVGVGNKVVGGLADWIKDLVIPDAAPGAPGRPGAGGKAGMGIAAMTQALRALDPSARVTSSYRPGAITATGYPSFHGLGRAIDIVSPNMGRTWDLLRNAFGATAAELFFTPRGFLRNGRMGSAAPVTRRTHFSHVHWAMQQGGIVPTLYDTGGDVPPGLSLVANKTRKPEVTLTNKFVEEVRANMRGGGMQVSFDGAHIGYDPRDVSDALERGRQDQLALAGLLDDPGV